MVHRRERHGLSIPINGVVSTIDSPYLTTQRLKSTMADQPTKGSKSVQGHYESQQIDRPNCFADEGRGVSGSLLSCAEIRIPFSSPPPPPTKRKGETIINSPQFISGYFLCRILGKYAVMRTLCNGHLLLYEKYERARAYLRNRPWRGILCMICSTELGAESSNLRLGCVNPHFIVSLASSGT